MEAYDKTKASIPYTWLGLGLPVPGQEFVGAAGGITIGFALQDVPEKHQCVQTFTVDHGKFYLDFERRVPHVGILAGPRMPPWI